MVLHGLIYQILNLTNGKCYIGQHSGKRAYRAGFKRRASHLKALRDNCHDNQHLQNSWNKHGEKAFQINVLYRVTADVSKAEMSENPVLLGGFLY